jgi:hypothetical protein
MGNKLKKSKKKEGINGRMKSEITAIGDPPH